MIPCRESAESPLRNEGAHRLRQPLLVLGIGNVLLSDEGAGVHAVRRLARQLDGASGVRCVDGGSVGLALAGEIEACRALVVIDAAELGRSPGTIDVFEGAAMDRFLARPAGLSVHEAGLADLMAAAALEERLPSRRALIGIQPGSLEWGTEPTDAVADGVRSACELAHGLIRRWTMQKGVIPIVPAAPDPGPATKARALLHELAVRLERLVHEGESSSIDLSAMPLSAEDYRELREALGGGAVTAQVQAGGMTEVRETVCPGAWWITHADEGGTVLAEAIEVCAVPPILSAPPEDMSAGLARLQQSLRSEARGEALS